MMNPQELIDRLTTDREWAQANEWESQICLQDDLSAAISAITTLTEENAQLRAEILDLEAQHRAEFCEAALYDCVELGKVRAELERVKRERDAYMFCSKDLLSRGNCNECGNRENCDYLPRPGETVRANCPLWRGPQKEE